MSLGCCSQNQASMLVLTFCIMVTTVLECRANGTDAQSYDYQKWRGVPAPELSNVLDRINGSEISIAKNKGHRILFCSFDAGNFAKQPDMERLLADLKMINIVQTKNTNIVLVGFTRGVMFFGWGAPEGIKELTNFPIVNLNNKWDEKTFAKPYQMLLEPGLIVIDEKGFIVHLYHGPLSEERLRDAIDTPIWAESPRQVPIASEGEGIDDEYFWALVLTEDLEANVKLTRRHLAKEKVHIKGRPQQSISIDDAKTIVGMILQRSLVARSPLSWRDVGTNAISVPRTNGEESVRTENADKDR